MCVCDRQWGGAREIAELRKGLELGEALAQGTAQTPNSGNDLEFHLVPQGRRLWVLGEVCVPELWCAPQPGPVC